MRRGILDLQVTQDEQRDLWQALRSNVPALSGVDRFWLEPSGARCTVLGSKIEIDLGLDARDGALRVEFEAAREKTWLPGSHKLPDPAWRWQVFRVVDAAKTTLPPVVTLELDDLARVLLVRVAGWRFVRCLVNGERLILEAIPDA